jgi:hypothetical protein
VGTEVLAEDAVVGLAHFAMLGENQLFGSVAGYMVHTTNLRSFVNAKRTTASIRSKGSLESLILNKG